MFGSKLLHLVMLFHCLCHKHNSSAIAITLAHSYYVSIHLVFGSLHNIWCSKCSLVSNIAALTDHVKVSDMTKVSCLCYLMDAYGHVCWRVMQFVLQVVLGVQY